MKEASDDAGYALGYSDAEEGRLIRQAARLAPFTRLLFTEAGICSGQRILDVGSGVGDVAMLAAELVGPSGEVVGVERSAASVARARARATAAGIANLRFVAADASELAGGERFDAIVGRFVLQFIPNPAAALRSLLRLARPGAIIAFQEIVWSTCLDMNAHLPLWSACAKATTDAIRSKGAQTDMGLALYEMFQEAGLPAPTIRIDMNGGATSDFTNWTSDLFGSLRPDAASDPNLTHLGDLSTLAERIHAEVIASRGILTSPAYDGAYTRTRK